MNDNEFTHKTYRVLAILLIGYGLFVVVGAPHVIQGSPLPWQIIPPISSTCPPGSVTYLDPPCPQELLGKTDQPSIIELRGVEIL
jgi:hypothetical protein